MLMQNLGGQTKSIMVFSEVAYRIKLVTLIEKEKCLIVFLSTNVHRNVFDFKSARIFCSVQITLSIILSIVEMTICCCYKDNTAEMPPLSFKNSYVKLLFWISRSYQNLKIL